MNPIAPSPAAPAPSASSGELAVLQPAKASGYRRAIEVGLRSLHLVSMGLVLGGIPLGGTWETLRVPIVATLATGVLLLIVCMRWGCLEFTLGAGWAVLLKLGLLGLGNVFEGARLEFYAAATLVASVGSHMPSAWRHFTFAGRAGSSEGRSGPRAV